jgi:hypothetical protein
LVKNYKMETNNKKITDYLFGKYPDNLFDCLKLMETVRYESYGFPIFSLYFNYTFNRWETSFRNPVNFSNQDNLNDKDPLVCLHKTFDFLKELYKKNGFESNKLREPIITKLIIYNGYLCIITKNYYNEYLDLKTCDITEKGIIEEYFNVHVDTIFKTENNENIS